MKLFSKILRREDNGGNAKDDSPAPRTPRTFRSTFSTISFALTLNAVYPGDDKTLARLLHLLVNYSIAVSSLGIVSYTMVVDIGEGKYEDATRQISIGVLQVILFVKMGGLAVHEGMIVSIIGRIDADYARAPSMNDADRATLVRQAAAGRLLQRAWSLIVFLAGQIFVTSAVAFTWATGRRHMIFDCVLPWGDARKLDTPYYELFACYEMLIDLLTTTLYVGFDSLMPVFVLHLCGRLEMAERKLRSLYSNKIIKGNGRNLSDDERVTIRNKLSNIVEDLQSIYRLATDINTTSGNVYNAIFFFSSILTTASAYQIISCIKHGIVPYEFTMFFVATIFHTFIPCYYGNLMMEKSLSICNAAYECSWELVPDKSSKKTLQIIMLRAQKSLTIHTHFQPVNLALFNETIKHSWTLFNLLLAVFE